MFVLAAGFCFACMSLFLKLSGDLPTFQKSFFRNLVAIFFALGIMIKDHVPFRLEDRSGVKYLWARAIGGTVGIFCNFYAVDHMVIADANMLNKLSPFFAMIFSFFKPFC
jgi:drug/metabolite transporter (DMT)-like permease